MLKPYLITRISWKTRAFCDLTNEETLVFVKEARLDVVISSSKFQITINSTQTTISSSTTTNKANRV